MNKYNVTYLLGAGASARCLPVINNIQNRLSALKNTLFRYIINPEEIETDVKYIARELANDIDWLMQESANHQTIDTLAKKFYLGKKWNEELFKLKRILIVLFLFEQKLPNAILTQRPYIDYVEEGKENFDKRYDTFFASLLDLEGTDLKLADNVKIITWNYDIQIEIALQNYINKQFNDLQDYIQSIPRKALYVNNNNVAFDTTKFSVIRLNGLAINENLSKDNFGFDFFTKQHTDATAFLIDLLDINESLAVTQANTFFNYSWEDNAQFYAKDTQYQTRLECAKKVAQQTDVLVIIGYSFPVFNRKTDQAILDAMGNLSKVYIQDPQAEKIRNIFFSTYKNINVLGKHNVVIDDSKNQFVFPFELNSKVAK